MFFGGRLRIVETSSADDSANVVDPETGRVDHSVEIVGRLTHAHVERPGNDHEYLVTRAVTAVRVGAVQGWRIELAWFRRDRAALRRVHRVLRRSPLASALAPDLPRGDVATVAILSDGMLVDGDELVSPRAVGEDRQRIGRFTDAPVRAVVGESATQTRSIFLLGDDGLVTATAANGVRRWYGVIRGLDLERLHLSGDGAILCAVGERTLVAWDAATGALLSEQNLPGSGPIHPAPVGRQAVLETSDGPHLVDLAPSSSPIAQPAPFDHAVRIEDGALVVHRDTDGLLADLVRAVVTEGVGPERFAASEDPYRTSSLSVGRTADAPMTLLEPWSVERGGDSMNVEGFVLRRLVTEASSQDAERLRRLARRDASLAVGAQRDLTRERVRVNDALEAAILASPDAREPYLVYGDWLLEQGDPRGELVALQTRLAQEPDNVALRERERALLALHSRGWLGSFVRDFDGEWQLGFVRALSLSRVSAASWHELRTLPAFRFVRRLSVAVQRDPFGFLAAVSADGYPPALRDLTLLGPVPADVRSGLIGSRPELQIRFTAA